jgi:hypothetical protein
MPSVCEFYLLFIFLRLHWNDWQHTKAREATAHVCNLIIRMNGYPFVQVECSYCIAQVLDIFEDKRESYELGDVRTSLFLIVAFDQDKTLARLSYISDGLEISTEE